MKSDRRMLAEHCRMSRVFGATFDNVRAMFGAIWRYVVEIYVSTTVMMALAFLAGVIVGALGLLVWGLWAYNKRK